MNWQLAIVGMLVGGASVYLAHTVWRSWKGSKTGCGGGCGCGKKVPSASSPDKQGDFIPLEQLGLRQKNP